MTHLEDGHRDTFSLDLTTDGRITALDREDLSLRAHVAWDGDCLVFDTRVSRGGVSGENVVRSTMAPDRNSIRAEERFRSATLIYENVWVLDRRE